MTTSDEAVLVAQAPAARPADSNAIRPFTYRAPQSELDDLRRRIAATRFPENEPWVAPELRVQHPDSATDFTQGVKLATMQKLAQYWAKEYDWRKVEARLNALPQFITEIDGLDIHFIHVRSKHDNALPLIVTHGWPGSVIEQLKIIDPLVNPTAHGGKASDAFHVVIPSMPGYGFSGKPTRTGWGPERIARAWAVLMKRIGYTRYVAQGGDWGALIVDMMGAQAPPELLASTPTCPARFHRPSTGGRLPAAQPPAGLSAEERHAFDQLAFFYKHGLAYAQEWATARKRFTGSRIHPLASPHGSSTTMHAASSSSRGCLTGRPRALRGTTCWTTSRFTG